MAHDKVVDSAVLDAGMTATANAIRAKTNGTKSIPWENGKGFAEAILKIAKYELVTVSQSCSNVREVCDALGQFVGEDDQIVLFVNENYTSIPIAETANNTGLWFMWFATTFNANEERRYAWSRWRDGDTNLNGTTNTNYDYIVPSGTVFRKVVVR